MAENEKRAKGKENIVESEAANDKSGSKFIDEEKVFGNLLRAQPELKKRENSVGVMICPIKNENGATSRHVFRVPVHCVQDWKLMTKSSIQLQRVSHKVSSSADKQRKAAQENEPMLVEETPFEEILADDEFIPSSQDSHSPSKSDLAKSSTPVKKYKQTRIVSAPSSKDNSVPLNPKNVLARRSLLKVDKSDSLIAKKKQKRGSKTTLQQKPVTSSLRNLITQMARAGKSVTISPKKSEAPGKVKQMNIKKESMKKQKSAPNSAKAAPIVDDKIGNSVDSKAIPKKAAMQVKYKLKAKASKFTKISTKLLKKSKTITKGHTIKTKGGKVLQKPVKMPSAARRRKQKKDVSKDDRTAVETKSVALKSDTETVVNSNKKPDLDLSCAATDAKSKDQKRISDIVQSSFSQNTTPVTRRRRSRKSSASESIGSGRHDAMVDDGAKDPNDSEVIACPLGKITCDAKSNVADTESKISSADGNANLPVADSESKNPISYVSVIAKPVGRRRGRKRRNTNTCSNQVQSSGDGTVALESDSNKGEPAQEEVHESAELVVDDASSILKNDGEVSPHPGEETPSVSRSVKHVRRTSSRSKQFDSMVSSDQMADSEALEEKPKPTIVSESTDLLNEMNALSSSSSSNGASVPKQVSGLIQLSSELQVSEVESSEPKDETYSPEINDKPESLSPVFMLESPSSSLNNRATRCGRRIRKPLRLCMADESEHSNSRSKQKPSGTGSGSRNTIQAIESSNSESSVVGLSDSLAQSTNKCDSSDVLPELSSESVKNMEGDDNLEQTDCKEHDQIEKSEVLDEGTNKVQSEQSSEIPEPTDWKDAVDENVDPSYGAIEQTVEQLVAHVEEIVNGSNTSLQSASVQPMEDENANEVVGKPKVLRRRQRKNSVPKKRIRKASAAKKKSTANDVDGKNDEDSPAASVVLVAASLKQSIDITSVIRGSPMSRAQMILQASLHSNDNATEQQKMGPILRSSPIKRPVKKYFPSPTAPPSASILKRRKAAAAISEHISSPKSQVRLSHWKPDVSSFSKS